MLSSSESALSVNWISTRGSLSPRISEGVGAASASDGALDSRGMTLESRGLSDLCMWIGVCPPCIRYLLSQRRPCSIAALKVPVISSIAAMIRRVKDLSPGRLVIFSTPVAASNSVFPAIPAVAAKQVSKIHNTSLVESSKLIFTLDQLMVILLFCEALEKNSVSTLITLPGAGWGTHRQILFSFLLCTPCPL